MMKKSMKRMILTGAAVAVLMSFAAPALAQEVRDHRDGSAEAGPIVRDHRDGSGGILCDIFSISCEPPEWNVNDPVIPPVSDPDPVVDPKPPKHCQFLPKGCKPPFDDVPVLDPVVNDDPVVTDPPVTDPPGKEDPVTDPPGKDESDKEDPDKEGSDTNGGSSGGSNGGSGSSVSSASQTIDLGGTFVSGFLPTTLTSTIGDVGNSVKKNLPAPVAKSLPNTGGGWSLLVVVGAALIAVGLVLRSIVRRTTSITRTAHQ